MGNTLFKIFIGGLAGFGFGLFVGKYERDRLEAERDELDLRNTCLTAECEITNLCNDNLRATNELFTNLLLQKENEEP